MKNILFPKGQIGLQQRTMSTDQILGNPIILLKCYSLLIEAFLASA